jgi:hypothetical protein
MLLPSMCGIIRDLLAFQRSDSTALGGGVVADRTAPEPVLIARCSTLVNGVLVTGYAQEASGHCELDWHI